MRKARVGAAQGWPAEYMDFVPYAKGAYRRGTGMACRNSFAGLVMLPGLEISSFFLAL